MSDAGVVVGVVFFISELLAILRDASLLPSTKMS